MTTIPPRSETDRRIANGATNRDSEDSRQRPANSASQRSITILRAALFAARVPNSMSRSNRPHAIRVCRKLHLYRIKQTKKGVFRTNAQINPFLLTVPIGITATNFCDPTELSTTVPGWSRTSPQRNRFSRRPTGTNQLAETLRATQALHTHSVAGSHLRDEDPEIADHTTKADFPTWKSTSGQRTSRYCPVRSLEASEGCGSGSEAAPSTNIDAVNMQVKRMLGRPTITIQVTGSKIGALKAVTSTNAH